MIEIFLLNQLNSENIPHQSGFSGKPVKIIHIWFKSFGHLGSRIYGLVLGIKFENCLMNYLYCVKLETLRMTMDTL